MTDEAIKRSLVAHRSHFDKGVTVLEQKLADFVGNRSSFNLKEIQIQLEFVRKQFEKVSEKGAVLAESEDEETGKYGVKEMEEISEKYRKIQEKYGKDTTKTETSKTEHKAGMFAHSTGGLGASFSHGFNQSKEDIADPDLEEEEMEIRGTYNDGRGKRKDDPIPTWRPRVTFEAWESSLGMWMDEVKYTDQQYVTKLLTMLQGKDVSEEVRDFTINLGERRKECRDTVKKIMGALKDKFSETEDEKYKRKVRNFRKFDYKGKKAEEALDEMDKMDDIRYQMREIM